MDYLFPENAAISAECRDLIQKILVADPNKRLSIAEIFQHPWVQQVGGSGPGAALAAARQAARGPGMTPQGQHLASHPSSLALGLVADS